MFLLLDHTSNNFQIDCIILGMHINSGNLMKTPNSGWECLLHMKCTLLSLIYGNHHAKCWLMWLHILFKLWKLPKDVRHFKCKQGLTALLPKDTEKEWARLLKYDQDKKIWLIYISSSTHPRVQNGNILYSASSLLSPTLKYPTSAALGRNTRLIFYFLLSCNWEI